MKTMFLLLGGLFFAGCTASPKDLKKVMSENPDIIFEAIEKNPEAFAKSIEKSMREARRLGQEKQEKDAKTAMEEEFKNPKTPEIASDRAVLGSKEAPILVVEYSDFQCPFCSRGYQTVKELKKKYGDKIRFMYKHLPLDFHPLAMPAAQRFEAIALQSTEKAYAYHDAVFENQKDLNAGGEAWLDKMAKKVGADVTKMKKDITDPKVADRIKADIAEAQKFGITGTPGFVVAGVTLRGAYPIASFDEIIEKKLGRGVSNN